MIYQQTRVVVLQKLQYQHLAYVPSEAGIFQRHPDPQSSSIVAMNETLFSPHLQESSLGAAHHVLQDDPAEAAAPKD